MKPPKILGILLGAVCHTGLPANDSMKILHAAALLAGLHILYILCNVEIYSVHRPPIQLCFASYQGVQYSLQREFGGG